MDDGLVTVGRGSGETLCPSCRSRTVTVSGLDHHRVSTRALTVTEEVQSLWIVSPVSHHSPLPRSRRSEGPTPRVAPLRSQSHVWFVPLDPVVHPDPHGYPHPCMGPVSFSLVLPHTHTRAHTRASVPESPESLVPGCRKREPGRQSTPQVLCSGSTPT